MKSRKLMGYSSAVMFLIMGVLPAKAAENKKVEVEQTGPGEYKIDINGDPAKNPDLAKALAEAFKPLITMAELRKQQAAQAKADVEFANELVGSEVQVDKYMESIATDEFVDSEGFRFVKGKAYLVSEADVFQGKIRHLRIRAPWGLKSTWMRVELVGPTPATPAPLLDAFKEAKKAE